MTLELKSNLYVGPVNIFPIFYTDFETLARFQYYIRGHQWVKHISTFILYFLPLAYIIFLTRISEFISTGKHKFMSSWHQCRRRQSEAFLFVDA